MNSLLHNRSQHINLRKNDPTWGHEAFLTAKEPGHIRMSTLTAPEPQMKPFPHTVFSWYLIRNKNHERKKKTNLRQLDVCSVSCLDMCWISASKFNHWKNTYTTKNFFTEFLNFWSSYSVGNGRNVISGYLLSLICGCLCWGEWLNAKILGWTGGKRWSLPVLGSA